MANSGMLAIEVRVGRSTDGDSLAVIGTDLNGNRMAIGMDAAAAQALIVELLQQVQRLPPGLPIGSETGAGTVETIAATQLVVGTGEAGPILSVMVGPARLGFRLASVESLRSVGRAALEAAEDLDRANPTGPALPRAPQ